MSARLGGHFFLCGGCPCGSYNPATPDRDAVMSQEDKKRRVAAAALAEIGQDLLLGVGTGSTVNHFIDALAASGLRPAATVASSAATEEKLRAAGLPVEDLNDVGDVDVYVDGADEANRHFHLVKGGGGALTREKVLAAASKRFVCIVDDSKWVDTLGDFPLPVEVIPMARSYVARELVRAGGRPVWREGFVTDNGNDILDVHQLRIVDPPALESRLNQIAGVVTVGLFAQRPADLLLIADQHGVRRLDR